MKNKACVIIPILIFAIFSFTSFKTYSFLENSDKEYIENKHTNMRNLLGYLVQSQFVVVDDIKTFFESSQFVDREEFSTFVNQIKHRDEFLNVNGAAFVQRVKFEDKEDFIEGVRNDTHLNPDGYPDFDIKPDQDSIEYYVINYLEPHSEAFGYNQRSESKRRLMLENARDNNQRVISEVLELVGENNLRKAVLVATPVFETGTINNTVEQRREHLVGFITAALFVEEHIEFLLEDSGIQSMIGGIDFKIADSGETIFSNFDKDTNLKNIVSSTSNIGGRTWDFSVAMKKGQGNQYSKYIVSVMMFIVGLVITSITYISLNKNNQIQKKIINLKKEKESLIKELNKQKENNSEGRLKDLSTKISNLEKEIFEKDENLEALNTLLIEREEKIRKAKEND